MKLADVLKTVAPFLATDKKIGDVSAAIIAADKKAKDAAGSGLGARELEEKDKAKAQDAREAACDEREEAMDAAEEKEDKDKAEDKAAKDRKSARDARKGARDSRKGARDKAAKDRDDDPEHTNDEDLTEGSNASTPGGSRAGGKTAIDSAEVDKRIAAAVAATRAESAALHTAQEEVAPIVGRQAFDSAPAAYRAALEALKVDGVKDVPDAALPAMLRLAKDKAAASATLPAALDGATVSAIDKVIPGYSRLR